MTTIAPSPTPHGVHQYQGQPKSERAGVALCLSGGGFRAALFHLGALRRLNELDILSQVTTITAVSGGATVAAHLADRLRPWRRLDAADWEQHVAGPFRAFASKNLSGKPVLIGWLLPWNWWSNGGINALARACEERLTSLTLDQLPDQPRFVFCATNLVSGNSWLIERTHGASWSLGKAAAVSSCFPGYFRPYQETKPRRIALVDGGLHDNLGVEPVWRSHEILLVSDGGDVFHPEWGQSLLWSLLRSARVMFNQVQEVRKRWLLANFMSGEMVGAYWGISSATSHYLQQHSPACPGYSTALARDLIATIRTHYDAFSDVEAAVLENHGYFLADAATLAHLPALRPHPAPPLKIPHPAWMSERKVREALRGSSKNRFWGRW